MPRKKRVLQVKEDFDLKALEHPRSYYTKEQKISAITTYVLTGSIEAAAKNAGVPRHNVSDWKCYSSWWPLEVAKVRIQEQDKLDAIMTGVIDNTMTQLNDRIEHGDWKKNTKTGELERIPLTAKDLSIVAGITFDKRQLIRGDATAITSRSSSTDLKELEDKMMGWAKKVQQEKVVNAPKTISPSM